MDARLVLQGTKAVASTRPVSLGCLFLDWLPINFGLLGNDLYKIPYMKPCPREPNAETHLTAEGENDVVTVQTFTFLLWFFG